MGRRLSTTYTQVSWSQDGTLVTKVRLAAVDARRRFRNELRVNRLLIDERPPVPAPRLVAHDVQHRRLTFEAFAGEPLGPKYPHTLEAAQVDAVADLALRLRTYQPRRRWLRRIDPVRRLRLAHSAGVLTAEQLTDLLPLADQSGRRLTFAHGDLTARNVLAATDQGRNGGELALIDWEWSGLCPPGYDLAFLWYSLVDVPAAADRVEHLALSRAGVDEPAFLLSALLVQLWHLQWYLPKPFRTKHLTRRDHLLGRLTTNKTVPSAMTGRARS